MNKTIKIFSFVLLCIICLSSCGKTNNIDLWADAMYTSDATLGSGEKNIILDVSAGDKTVTFTISTDAENLGVALLELNLISGEEGAYGLYVKSVNGIIADFETDSAYWAVTKNKEYLSTGVDGVKISDGEHYELTYTIG